MPLFNTLKSYAAGYLSAATTTPTITAGTPVRLDISSFILNYSQNFVVSGSDLIYTGTPTVLMDGKASVSVSADTTGTVITFYRGKNGVYIPESALIRKVAGGGDIGSVTLIFGGELSTNEGLEIWVDSSLGGTVTVEKVNLSIENVTI